MGLLRLSIIIMIMMGYFSCTPKNKLLNLKKDYAKLVHLNYQDCLQEANFLQKTIEKLLKNPTAKNFSEAKKQWVKARIPYGQSEAFRFFGGPIDSINEATGEEGPEGELNSWPVNEAYIDYVKGKKKSGIVNSDIVLTDKTLRQINGKGDEANVAIGYHAIEFLLWGQDLNKNDAGMRTVQDYVKLPVNERRRQYLSKVVDLLVQGLEILETAWNSSNEKAFYHEFMNWDEDKFINSVLTSLGTLSGFELASERMATALLSGDQEDEQSCFSDTTHNDFIANQRGIMNVYFCEYEGYKGLSLNNYFATKSAKENKKLVIQMKKTMRLLELLPVPIDKILRSEVNSLPRKQLKEASDNLIIQAELIVELAKRNNYNKVHISGD